MTPRAVPGLEVLKRRVFGCAIMFTHCVESARLGEAIYRERPQPFGDGVPHFPLQHFMRVRVTKIREHLEARQCISDDVLCPAHVKGDHFEVMNDFEFPEAPGQVAEIVKATCASVYVQCSMSRRLFWAVVYIEMLIQLGC